MAVIRFRADNLPTLRELFRFLGVDPDFRPDVAEINVGGKAPKARWMQDAFRTATTAGGAIGRVRAAIPRSLRQRMIERYSTTAFSEVPPVSPELAAHIREIAAPQVARLGQRIGRDLVSEWDLPASRSTAA